MSLRNSSAKFVYDKFAKEHAVPATSARRAAAVHRPRIISWFTDFGIPVGGVVVNGIIQPDAGVAEVPEFVRNRMAMQAEHLGEIRDTFDGLVRAIVPLYETEVRGVQMLDRVGKAVLG